MALLSCPECGSQVSDRARSCPHCGYPIQEHIEDALPVQAEEAVEEAEAIDEEDCIEDAEAVGATETSKVECAVCGMLLASDMAKRYHGSTYCSQCYGRWSMGHPSGELASVHREAVATTRQENRRGQADTPSASMQNNPYALTGLVLGFASVFLYVVGILPVLAVVFSAIGLGTFDERRHKNRWTAIVGLVLGILYTIMYMHAYGHI